MYGVASCFPRRAGSAAATRGRAELTLSEARRGRPPALPEPGAGLGQNKALRFPFWLESGAKSRPHLSPFCKRGFCFLLISEVRVRVEVWGAGICVPRTALSLGMAESPGHIASCVCHPRAPQSHSHAQGFSFLALVFSGFGLSRPF